MIGERRAGLDVLGWGTALPPHVMTQREAVELNQRVSGAAGKQADTLRALFRLAGVERRHTCVPHRLALRWLEAEAGGDAAALPREPSPLPEVNLPARLDPAGPTTGERMQLYAEHAPPLALAAARAALDHAGLAPRAISHLVTVSCTGFAAPGVDRALIAGLGLRPTVERVQVGYMGCHGAINGLRVARALAAAEPAGRVLLAAVELCSLHYSYAWHPERLVGNALFADGAAAVVGAWGGAAEADGGAWRLAATGSCLIPDSAGAMAWTIGDHGFEMLLSAEVPGLVGEHLRAWLVEWLAAHGVALEAVGSWAIHPGGPRILRAVEDALGLDAERTRTSREVLREHGNMSSPTVLFVLERLRRAGAARPCVALGFGPGLVAEAALWT